MIGATGAAAQTAEPGAAGAWAERLERFYRAELTVTGPIALHEPWFAGNEWAYVKETLDTNWVSSAGPFVDRFEAACAEICGARHAIATVNGTCALHIALVALGVGPGDLVVCPAISFVGTANAIAHCGAQPLFVDVGDSRLALDARQLRTFLADECTGAGPALRHVASGRRVAAVVAVHIFGHPADLDAINAVADEFGLTVVEDAAESIGSRYRGRACGALARVGVLSFNGNKTVTAGGGGAVVTNDTELAQRIRHLTTTAKIANGLEFDHDEVGYNYRMPNINAALACAQLERLDFFVGAKRALAECYGRMFGASFVTEPLQTRSNYWLCALILDSKAERDLFLRETQARGVQTRPVWRALPRLPMYRSCLRAAAGLATAFDVAERIVNLPSSPQLAARLG